MYLSLFISKGVNIMGKFKGAYKGRDPLKKKTFSFRHYPNNGGGGEGGLPMPEFFDPLSRIAFLVKKRVYFFKNANVLNF